MVRHGGGGARVRLSLPRGFDPAAIPDPARYWLLNALYHAYAEGIRTGRDMEGGRWRTAAAERRIRVRKVRGQGMYTVSIDAGAREGGKPC